MQRGNSSLDLRQVSRTPKRPLKTRKSVQLSAILRMTMDQSDKD